LATIREKWPQKVSQMLNSLPSSKEITLNTNWSRELSINNEVELMKIVPFLIYMVWDGLNQDFEATIMYERLMDSQEDSLVRTYALIFLVHSCMIGQ